MEKFLFQPVKPFIINQRFGENQACVDIATGKKVITCDGNNPPAGYKSLYGAGGHKGMDLAAKHGQSVYNAGDGVVDAIDTNPKSGLDVKVISEHKGVRVKHIYEHLLGYQPKIGDKLKVGDLIGWADNTGYSAGDHLHFETQVWDAKGKKWIPTNPMLLMEPIFALTFAGMWRQVQEAIAKLAEYIADKNHKK